MKPVVYRRRSRHTEHEILDFVVSRHSLICWLEAIMLHGETNNLLNNNCRVTLRCIPVICFACSRVCQLQSRTFLLSSTSFSVCLVLKHYQCLFVSFLSSLSLHIFSVCCTLIYRLNHANKVIQLSRTRTLNQNSLIQTIPITFYRINIAYSKKR